MLCMYDTTPLRGPAVCAHKKKTMYSSKFFTDTIWSYLPFLCSPVHPPSGQELQPDPRFVYVFTRTYQACLHTYPTPLLRLTFWHAGQGGRGGGLLRCHYVLLVPGIPQHKAKTNRAIYVHEWGATCAFFFVSSSVTMPDVLRLGVAGERSPMVIRLRPCMIIFWAGRTLTPHKGDDRIAQVCTGWYKVRHPRGSYIVIPLLSLESGPPGKRKQIAAAVTNVQEIRLKSGS